MNASHQLHTIAIYWIKEEFDDQCSTNFLQNEEFLRIHNSKLATVDIIDSFPQRLCFQNTFTKIFIGRSIHATVPLALILDCWPSADCSKEIICSKYFSLEWNFLFIRCHPTLDSPRATKTNPAKSLRGKQFYFSFALKIHQSIAFQMLFHSYRLMHIGSVHSSLCHQKDLAPVISTVLSINKVTLPTTH